jgi:serine/threonine-protein kinase
MKEAMTPERWKKIEDIYHQAQQHDARERPAILDKACAGDAELRREVESLLEADNEAETFLARPAMNLAAQMIADDQRPALIGKRISHYEVVERIGAGGMGEVYRARDTRLGREVAIKILPLHFARDDELRRRFEREARAISSLSHAHICAIYDVGHQDGINYLVLEYVEGETLTSRLARGPMPVDQALRYAIEIADALDHAHRRAIVHRDLKPGNIILNKSGAKLLDFGLAKFQQPGARGRVVASSAPTESAQLTGKGTIVGTLQYMAPEQLEGKEADARTDIFALGSVIYEMTTGQRAFEGQNQASLIAAILTVEPRPMSELQPVAPAALERVVKACLAKDPDERWQTAHDLMLELKWIAGGSSQSQEAAAVTTKRTKRERLWWVAALFVTALFVGVTAWLLARAPASTARPLARFALELPANLRLAKDERPVIALSPDGTSLVYLLTSGASTQLYVRRLDQLEAAPIPGTEGASGPFFSPDGEWVGYYAGGRLKKVSLLGGAPHVICNVPPVMHGASWGPDDTIFYSPAHSWGIFRVSAAGGQPQVVTTPDGSKGERGHYWPQVLPGGKHILFTIGTRDSYDDARIVTQSLETGERKVLVDGGTCGRYLPSGHLVYARAGALLAVPFDLSSLEVEGVAVPVVEGVKVDSRSGAANFSFSNLGSLLYVSGKSDADMRELVWVDRRGQARPFTDAKDEFRHPTLSPDGLRLAISIEGVGQNIWLYDMARGTLTKLTYEMDWRPAWTPDGSRIAYTSNRVAMPPGIVWRSTDGSGEVEVLVASENPVFTGSWSPDGKVLAYTDGFGEEVLPKRATGNDIWLLRLEGERKPEPFLRTQFDEFGPEFSPDGRWIAYVSNESGRNEVYLASFPRPGGKRQISTGGGTSPRWARNGKELFYRNGNRMMAVAISLQPEFKASTPQVLFEGEYEEAGRPDTPHNYDVTPDGRQFVMLRPYVEPSAPSQLIMALEWFDDLSRRALKRQK